MIPTRLCRYTLTARYQTGLFDYATTGTLTGELNNLLSHQDQIAALNCVSPRRDFFSTAEVKLPSLSVKLKVGTAPGCKEARSEDSVGVSIPSPTSLRCFVQDGVSSKVDCEERPGFLTSYFIRDFLKRDRSELHPTALLLSANAALKQYIRAIREERPALKNASFAAAGTVIEVNSATKQLTFGHVPDSFLIIRYVNGETALLTRDTNHEFDQKVMETLKKVAKRENITPKEARYHAEVVAKHREVSATKGNRADGQGTGLINGDELLSLYVQGRDASYSLDEVEAFLLATDGALPLGVDLNNHEHRSTLFSVVDESGIEGLISMKKESERRDPDWRKFPRFKDSDDATAISGEVSLIQESDAEAWPRRVDTDLSSKSIFLEGER